MPGAWFDFVLCLKKLCTCSYLFSSDPRIVQSTMVDNVIHSLLLACVPIKHMTTRTRYMTVRTSMHVCHFDYIHAHTGLIGVHGCYTWRELDSVFLEYKQLCKAKYVKLIKLFSSRNFFCSKSFCLLVEFLTFLILVIKK